MQSTAYPTPSSLDPNLYSLIYAPQESLEHLALLDNEGAAILHKALRGYATLRKFYDLRDSKTNLPEGQPPKRSPISHKKEAAAAILALISSAADSVHGGLYDPTIESIVHVDGLLTLLGEALPFINRTCHHIPSLTTPYPFQNTVLTSLCNNRNTRPPHPPSSHLPPQRNRRPLHSSPLHLPQKRRIPPFHPRRPRPPPTTSLSTPNAQEANEQHHHLRQQLLSRGQLAAGLAARGCDGRG